MHNTFGADIPTFIYVDNNNGNATKDGANVGLTGYPEYGSNIAINTTGYWKKDIIANANRFYVDGQLRYPQVLTSVQMTELDGKLFDKKDDPNIGQVLYYFPVTNLNTTEGFATIQSAIDDADTQNGHVINVEDGTYGLTDAVRITKSVILQGNSNLAIKPIINGKGNVINKALIEIDAPNVTVKNFEFQIVQDLDGLIGIASTTTDNFNNLTIADNVFKGMKVYTSGMKWESYAMRLGRGSADVAGGVPNNAVNVVRNTVTYNNLVTPELFGRGIYAFNTYGKIGGSIADKNTVIAAYALQGGELGGGVGNNFEFSYNDVPVGIVSTVGAEPGNHKISNNNIGFGVANLTQANNIGRMLEVKGNRTANAIIEVANNLVQNYSNIGIFIQRSDDVIIKNNTLTPFAGASIFNSIVFSSKEGTSGLQGPVTLENLTIAGNTLNGSGSNGGTGIAFWNHNGSAAVKPLINAKVGGSDTDKNTFSSDIANYIVLDATPSGTNTATTLMGGLYDIVQIGFPDRITNIFPFNGDIDASYNVFGTINSGTETNFDNLVSVKAKISDGIDDPLTGYVNIQPNKAFIGVMSVLANALTVVPDGFTLVLKNDNAVYANLGNRTITKAHTFAIDNYNIGEIGFGNLTINAQAKTITFTNPATVAGNFTLTAGKITPSASFTLNGSVATTPGMANFINGAVTINNVGSDMLIPVGKNNRAAYVELTGASGTASSFTVEYFPAAYVSSVKGPGLTSVSSNEYWAVNRTSGSLTAKVKLYSFDLVASGFGILDDAVVSEYSAVNNRWETFGSSTFVNGIPGSVTANVVSSNFGYFTFGANTAVLPVALLSFTAQPATGGALVKWSTAKEENNAKFEIEKSFDGKNFFVIDSRKGAGSAASYEFLDLSFRQSAYYRLVQFDAGGKKTTYSDLTKFVKGLDNSLAVVAYPNPATVKLYVSVASSTKENVKVLLTDLTGKTLRVKDADTSQPIELDVAGIARGSYIVQVIKNSGNVSKKILKL
ncbi:T9SS type A sorting domain-containing protein [Pedobacter sp.]